MKKHILISTLLMSSSLQAALDTSSGEWQPIGNTLLSPVFTDLDNGDGEGDGAIKVDGQDTGNHQGAQYVFGGQAEENEKIEISTTLFNENSSFVAYRVELYNVDDQVVLASFEDFIRGNTTTPQLVELQYSLQSSDVGDSIAVRYLRRSPFSTFRDLSIDNLALNGQFVSTLLTGPGTPCYIDRTPDLPLLTSSVEIDQEIQDAFERYQANYLASTPPSQESLDNAITLYDALNINVQNGQITGERLGRFADVSFLRTLVTHLKFFPNDQLIRERLNNTVWLTSSQFCAGIINENPNGYDYRFFARPTVLAQQHLDEHVQDLFLRTLTKHVSNWDFFWEPVFDAAFQANSEVGGINTDLVYNFGDVMLAAATWQPTADERYRYSLAFKRMMDRFLDYNPGTADGIKVDGTGFHHWTAYDHYMYSYETASDIISYLSGTRFQIDKNSYLRFRDAVYSQFVNSNEDGIKALSVSGRIVNNRRNSMHTRASSIKRLAIEGGNILGLDTADPILAGVYNRRFGVEDEFNYSHITPYAEQAGFYQYNYGHMGVFRKADEQGGWLAVVKGFSNYMWGTEIFPRENRYGRYQSYGALEIIYPGDETSGNGFELATWDWNFNPGATTIVLPWGSLHAERGRIDELQHKRFTGALSLSNRNSVPLNAIHGETGMFAMDFQEQEGLGFRDTFGPNTHNDSFTFKKSKFFFEDMIVSLGSNINNDDTANTTVTTLFQRLDNTQDTKVNGESQTRSSSFDSGSDNWMIDNFNTGFYVVSGSGELRFKKQSQQTPNHNQTNPADYTNNPVADYQLGYIDHGLAPHNASYEYVTLPKATPSDMAQFAATFVNERPYSVLQQDQFAHIVEHHGKDTWAYAIFEPTESINNSGLVLAVDDASLLMYKVDEYRLKRRGRSRVAVEQRVTMALTNPDLGFESRTNDVSVEKEIAVVVTGNWYFEQSPTNVQIINHNNGTASIVFSTVDGLPREISLIRIR